MYVSIDVTVMDYLFTWNQSEGSLMSENLTIYVSAVKVLDNLEGKLKSRCWSSGELEGIVKAL